MEELKPDGSTAEGPKPAEAGTAPRSPMHIVRPVQRPSTMDKTVGVLRTMLPLALKFLPLLDGQIGTVVSNFVGPQTTPRQVAQTLLPLQAGLAHLEKQHFELRAELSTQNATLKQIDEQIQTLRNLNEETAEVQRNLTADLKKMRRNVKLVAISGFVLLAGLVALNVVLFVQIRRILH
jgi:hypothetical protein